MEKSNKSFSHALSGNDMMPDMPPIFDVMVSAAPEQFRGQAALACLAPLGALGCQLEAEYLDGDMQSPLFQSNVVAPQASGKGKFGRLVERLLSPMERTEEEMRQAVEAYLERREEYLEVCPKATRQEVAEAVGPMPLCFTRDLGSKVSTTALMELTSHAHGLALMMSNDEADSMVKSWVNRHTDISDMFRIGWDGGTYKQHMATMSATFSGKVRLRICSAICGTPNAFQRMFKDNECGAASRQLFIHLPDMMFERLPKWRKLSSAEEEALEARLQELSEVSLEQVEGAWGPDWHVRERHVMDLDYVNARLEEWLEDQRLTAREQESRTRGTFYRRAAVMGFRAAMLAHYLWGEPAGEAVREKVCRFALWVADKALLGLMQFTQLEEDPATNFYAKNLYDSLGDTFTSDDVAPLVSAFGFRSRATDIVNKWNRSHRAVFTGQTIVTPLGPRKLYRKQRPPMLEAEAVESNQSNGVKAECQEAIALPKSPKRTEKPESLEKLESLDPLE